jgi:hypothetical protein
LTNWWKIRFENEGRSHPDGTFVRSPPLPILTPKTILEITMTRGRRLGFKSLHENLIVFPPDSNSKSEGYLPSADSARNEKLNPKRKKVE